MSLYVHLMSNDLARCSPSLRSARHTRHRSDTAFLDLNTLPQNQRPKITDQAVLLRHHCRSRRDFEYGHPGASSYGSADTGTADQTRGWRLGCGHSDRTHKSATYLDSDVAGDGGAQKSGRFGRTGATSRFQQDLIQPGGIFPANGSTGE